jgi:hypothetical protein
LKGSGIVELAGSGTFSVLNNAPSTKRLTAIAL